MKPHAIPEHFHKLDGAKTAVQVAKFFALWLVPGWLSYLLIVNLDPWWAAAPVFVLSLIGGHGLQCVALLGHEGTHFALHNDKWTSALLGVIFSSFAPFHMDTGFAVAHSEHHAFTNTPRDPDYMFFKRFNNFFSRLFLARVAASNRYMAMTLRLAFNRWPADRPLRVGLTQAEMVRLARINLLTGFGLLVLYAALTYFFPVAMIAVLWIPFVLAMLFSGLRPFVEHVQTQAGRGRDSRTWISPAFDLLYGSINYHQAHHLWPRVPSYRLRELHYWMKANGQGIGPESPEIYSTLEFLKVAAKSY